MKNSNGNNGSTTRTNNARKGTRGPRPIQTVAQLRENLLRDAVAKEMKKIDRKIAVEERKRSVAQKRVNAANTTLARRSARMSSATSEALRRTPMAS